MRRLLAVLAVGALLAVTGCTPETADNPEAATPAGPPCLAPAPSASAPAVPADMGRPLPAMAVRCFDGGRYTDVALLGAAPTIINLWASYCEPCRTELPAFQAVVTAAAGKVRVVGVVTKDRRDQAQSVIDEMRLTFPMLEDQDQQFAIALSRAVSKSVIALPATLFVAPGGRIVYTYQGTALDEATIRSLTAEHLGVTL